MRLSDYPEVYRESLAVFELWRRMGYSADCIFFSTSPISDQSMMVQMVLKHHGDTYSINLGLASDTVENVEATWSDLATRLRTFPQSELNDLWESSMARADMVRIVIAMELKGFRNLGRVN